MLVLGCGDGSPCFEALRRGASRVVGIDLDAEAVRRARRTAEQRGAPVEFAVRDVEREPLREVFDHVLCLGLLEQSRDPLRLLGELVERAAQSLILEIAEPTRVGGGAGARLRHFILSRSPIVYVGRSGTSHNVQGASRFRFSYGALENLLFYQRGVFARLRRLPSADGTRLVVVAEKRQIGDLLVVAGPTGSGKSSLIEKIQAREAPQLCERFGLGDGSSWPMMSAFDLVEPCDPHVEHALFHYDTLRPFMRSAHVHSRERTLEVLQTARRARVLTIWTPPSVLKERFDREDRKGSRGKRRRKEIRRLFGDPERLVAHYREWFEFCGSRGLETTVVLPLAGMKCISLDEWERDHARAPEAASAGAAVAGG